MANRIQLHIDTLRHMNDLTFSVYRSRSSDMSLEREHVMDVTQSMALKKRLLETKELLIQDPKTPYLFYVRRHFEQDHLAPTVYIDGKTVDPLELFLVPDIKQVEIYSSALGLYDKRVVQMDYEYETMLIWDSPKVESGKSYIGPPASALNEINSLVAKQAVSRRHIILTFDYEYTPVLYAYYIQAQDTAGSVSEVSEIKTVALKQEIVNFRIQQSLDKKAWEEVVLTPLQEWYVPTKTIENPANLVNTVVTPVSSKRTFIEFNNPWHEYRDYVRHTAHYRVRPEDDEDEFGTWMMVDSTPIVVKPKKIRIRRKVDNKTPASYNGTDAFTVFELDTVDVDETLQTILLVDDQLTEGFCYSYTFFYEDELGYTATPFFMISDNTIWQNIILLSNQQNTKTTTIPSPDFTLSFEIVDKLIEIGENA